MEVSVIAADLTIVGSLLEERIPKFSYRPHQRIVWKESRLLRYTSQNGSRRIQISRS